MRPHLSRNLRVSRQVGGAFSFGGLGAWAQSLSRLSTLPFWGATDTVRLPESLSGRCSFGGGVNRTLPWPSCRRLTHMGRAPLRQRIRFVTVCDSAVNLRCRQTCLLQATAGAGEPLSRPLMAIDAPFRVPLLNDASGKSGHASNMQRCNRTCWGSVLSDSDVRVHSVKCRARAPRSMAAACRRSMFNSYLISSSRRSSVSSNVPSAAATSQASA